MRQSVCRKRPDVRNHTRPSAPRLRGLPGAGAPLPMPDPGGHPGPTPSVLGCGAPAWEAPEASISPLPRGPGGSDILSAWDADPLCTGPVLPLRAQLGSCHVRALVCTCVYVYLSPHKARCPMSWHLRAQATPGSPSEPLCPQNGDGDGAWVTPGPRPGQLAEGRGKQQP